MGKRVLGFVKGINALIIDLIKNIYFTVILHLLNKLV